MRMKHIVLLCSVFKTSNCKPSDLYSEVWKDEYNIHTIEHALSALRLRYSSIVWHTVQHT